MKALAKAAVACAAIGASVALMTGPAAATPNVSSPSGNHTPRILAVDGDPIQADGNDDTGKWGLAGLLGLVGLFGYKKYRDTRTTTTAPRATTRPRV